MYTREAMDNLFREVFATTKLEKNVPTLLGRIIVLENRLKNLENKIKLRGKNARTKI